MQRSSDDRRFFRLGGFINKLRTVQGWNILSPTEVGHLASVWNEQLERRRVPESCFEELINRAVDHRLRFIRKGEQAPTISIELILAMHEDAVEEVGRKRRAALGRYQREEAYADAILEAVGDPAMMESCLDGAKHHGDEFETFDELLANAQERLRTAKEDLETCTTKHDELTVS